MRRNSMLIEHFIYLDNTLFSDSNNLKTLKNFNWGHVHMWIVCVPNPNICKVNNKNCCEDKILDVYPCLQCHVIKMECFLCLSCGTPIKNASVHWISAAQSKNCEGPTAFSISSMIIKVHFYPLQHHIKRRGGGAFVTHFPHLSIRFSSYM